MATKTEVHADDGTQYLTVTRSFDLPVNLLFRAHAEPEIVEQWMGTTVLAFEARPHGGWRYQTNDPQGNVVFAANGVFHAFVPNGKIIRTFEMENAPFDVQLEFLQFESLTEDTSRLTMLMVYKTAALRDQMLKLPFRQGLNAAHNRL